MPKIYRTLELKSRIQNSKLKKCTYHLKIWKNPKFGFINRIENFRTPSFLKLSLPCRPSLVGSTRNKFSFSYQLKYNRFIILAVDQDVQSATGCSIDASVEFIQSLEQKYKVDLLDKMNVTFKLGEHIAHKPLIDFKKW
jgi:hypothetical protein